MKKRILGITFIVALVVVAAFNINLNKSNVRGDLFLEDVGALAGNEVSYSCSVSVTCYDTWNPQKQTGTISCTGVESCSRTSTSVTCDGKTTYC